MSLRMSLRYRCLRDDEFSLDFARVAEDPSSVFSSDISTWKSGVNTFVKPIEHFPPAAPLCVVGVQNFEPRAWRFTVRSSRSFNDNALQILRAADQE
jgi:hypothetical protein